MSSYELVGNALCLDYANTVNQRSDPHRDWLTEPGGLRAWSHHAGLLPPPDHPHTPRPIPGPARPAPDPDRPERALDRRDGRLPEVDAVGLREAVYLAFRAIAAGGDPGPSDLAVITAVAAEGLAAAHLVPATPPRSSDASDQSSDASGQRYGGEAGERYRAGRAAYRLEWGQVGGEREVLWAVADSALELLRHGPLDRIGECPSCGWVFLDTSRNGRRRWCSMAMCGNAVKSARHYAKAR